MVSQQDVYLACCRSIGSKWVITHRLCQYVSLELPCCVRIVLVPKNAVLSFFRKERNKCSLKLSEASPTRPRNFCFIMASCGRWKKAYEAGLVSQSVDKVNNASTAREIYDAITVVSLILLQFPSRCQPGTKRRSVITVVRCDVGNYMCL
jgi:hypothetical protein